VAGILSEAETEAIHGALDAIAAQYEGAAPPASDAEDLHTWIEGELTARTGDAGRKIHTARSRNDQVATLLLLHARTEAVRIAEEAREVVRVLATRALEWAEVEMPLQTHTQFAAPGSAGTWALRHAHAFAAIADRLDEADARWARSCPLGSGAVAGSSIPVDRTVQAEALGFLAPSPNALLSTGGRDECVELLGILAHLGLHLGGLATDGIQFVQTPFGWIRYPADLATGSSMMPNKSNPDALELLRGESTALAAAHHHALTLLKGLPSGYNRDLQCLKPVVRDATALAGELLAVAGAFAEAVAFDEEALARAMRMGEIEATLRMEAAILAGTPMRDAHHAEAGRLHATPAAEGAAAGGSTAGGGSRADAGSVPDGEGALASGGKAAATRPGAGAYRTLGAASPAEVRRTATELLEQLTIRD